MMSIRVDLPQPDGPSKRDEFAGVDQKIGGTEGMHRLRAAAEGFRKPAELDARAHGVFTRKAGAGDMVPFPRR